MIGTNAASLGTPNAVVGIVRDADAEGIRPLDGRRCISPQAVQAEGVGVIGIFAIVERHGHTEPLWLRDQTA